jgi:hypothetical protein
MSCQNRNAYICMDQMGTQKQYHYRKLQASLLLTMVLLFAVVYNRRLISAQIHPLPAEKDNTPNAQRAALTWNQVHADSAISLISNGDLVLRSGSDAISALFRKVNTKDKSYSHAGIVFIENGYPFVYNCIGSASDPHELLKRDSLKAYIDPYHNLGYAIYKYHLSAGQIEKLHATVIQYFKERRTFDPYFDLQTDSSLYCTEFVYKAIIAATGDKKYFPTTHATNFNFVSVDNLFLRKDMRLVCKIGYIQ